jgi:hypothetical protein
MSLTVTAAQDLHRAMQALHTKGYRLPSTQDTGHALTILSQTSALLARFIGTLEGQYQRRADQPTTPPAVSTLYVDAASELRMACREANDLTRSLQAAAKVFPDLADRASVAKASD